MRPQKYSSQQLSLLPNGPTALLNNEEKMILMRTSQRLIIYTLALRLSEDTLSRFNKLSLSVYNSPILKKRFVKTLYSINRLYWVTAARVFAEKITPVDSMGEGVLHMGFNYQSCCVFHNPISEPALLIMPRWMDDILDYLCVCRNTFRISRAIARLRPLRRERRASLTYKNRLRTIVLYPITLVSTIIRTGDASNRDVDRYDGL